MDMNKLMTKFKDKFNSNYIPTQEEELEITELVAEGEADLIKVNAEVARLDGQLKAVLRTRDLIKQSMDAHRSLISPVRRLPLEIMQQIFFHCIPQKRNAVMHASEAPILLGRICSYWRTLAMEMPELWSSLHIVPPYVNMQRFDVCEARFQRKSEIIRMWLARAGTAPLRISFFWHWGDSREEQRLCNILLQTLLPYNQQWAELDLKIPLKMSSSLCSLNEPVLPLLESLTLEDKYTHVWDGPIETNIEIHLPSEAPRLRTFHLILHSGSLKLPKMPWAQLTQLCLETMVQSFFSLDSQELLTILRKCIMLQRCTLRFPLTMITSPPQLNEFSNVISLPKLEFLCIDGDQSLSTTSHISNTLANLHAPALKSLELIGRYGVEASGIPDQHFSALRTMLKQSICPLQKLELQSLSLNGCGLIQCLRLIPTLQELVINNSIIPHESIFGIDGPVMRLVEDDEIFKELVIREDFVDSISHHSHLCPNLTSLHLSLANISQTILCQLTRSRWTNVPKGVARLSSVRYVFSTEEEIEIVRDIQAMRDEGLEAILEFPAICPEQEDPSPWTGLTDI